MPGRSQAVTTLLGAIVVTQAAAIPVNLACLAFLSLGIQLVCFVPSYWYKTEKFYDLVGMFSYLALIIGGQWKHGAGINASNWRQLTCSALALVWAVRLGLFLFSRTCAHGGRDSRFDKVREHFFRFMTFWIVQAVWVFFTSFAPLMLQTMPVKPEFVLTDAVGLLLWTFGWGLELVADYQKSAWKQQEVKQNKDFIDTGLWRYSRHPNYLGEIIAWFGMWLLCLHGNATIPYALLSAVTPVFVLLLFTQISTDLTEQNTDKRLGGLAAYNEYKRRTPRLFWRL